MTGSRRRKPRTGCLVALGVLVVLMLAAVLVTRRAFFDDPASRAERVHGFDLPPSAESVVVHGDAWNPLRQLIGIDRASTTVFVAPRAEIERFLEQFPGRNDRVGVIVIDGFDPDRLPWDSERSPDGGYFIEHPSSGADFASIQLFELGEMMGVRVYSDWN